jgi:DNA replication protein DnaC
MLTTSEHHIAVCQRCADTFEYQPVVYNGKTLFTPQWCDACVTVLTAERDQQERETRQNARVEAFLGLVPPVYHNTDPAQIHANLAQLAAQYEFGPKGVGIIGRSGEGKTRAAYLIALRMVSQGRKVYWIAATDLAAAAANLYADDPEVKSRSNEKIRRAMTCELLVLDDLGKGKFTDRAESMLYDLFETRTGNMRPTIWTSNSNAKALHAMMSPDRADALIRRMGSEFHNIVRI